MRIALVLGSAGCVHEDVAAARALGAFDGIVGCNLIGREWPEVFDAWVSLHTDKLKRPWQEGRRRRGLEAHHALIGLGDTPHRFPGQEHHGSSGLFALKVALVDLGFDRAVLCGIPLDADAGHFNDPQPWAAADGYRQGWNQALPQIRRRARSMSGWTRQVLGAPTARWLSPSQSLQA